MISPRVRPWVKTVMIAMGGGGGAGSFDYDDPMDFEEWCAWNDVDEEEG